MQPHVSGQNHFNYCDLSTENYASSYFGDNLTKLQAVKAKYDPDDVFSYPLKVSKLMMVLLLVPHLKSIIIFWNSLGRAPVNLAGFSTFELDKCLGCQI
ncbi:MAG: BBE domain-containing protein [Candidatus Obscuribacterales bacterium]|nr:BBE domain-containing protein [Candidatus Obscuribacterales bacterium]